VWRSVPIGGLEGGYSPRERAELPQSDFVFPDRRGWPIGNEIHGKLGLLYVKRGFGKAEDWPVVVRTVLQRYPHLRPYAYQLLADRPELFSPRERE
jgi:hypothetical protein